MILFSRILILLFSFFAISGIAQSTTIVQYLFRQPNDEGGITEYLMYNDDEVYYFDDVDDKYPTMNEYLASYNIIRGGHKIYRSTSNPQLDKHIGRYFREEKQLLFLDNRPKISWEIKKEYKRILGYSCQMAVGDFRGRKYVVWFTKDIPVSFGPWKLDGLPGLILEARDSNDYLSFTALEVIKNSVFGIPKVAKDFVIKAELDKNVAPYKSFVEHLTVFMLDVAARQLATLPKDAEIVEKAPPIRSTWRELIYEWDNPNDPRLK